MRQFAIFDVRGRPLEERLFPESYAEKYEGCEEAVVEVELLNGFTYRLTLWSYWGSGGHLRLEITQPLVRAIRTFGALLMSDSMLEDRECEENRAALLSKAAEPWIDLNETG